MHIVIAGGHGQIALLLSRVLAGAGHRPVGLIRNPEHGDDLRAAGAEPAVIDLENATVDDLAVLIDGADAVVFAAGAGPDSGPERKLSVDRDGAILLADTAIAAGVRRMVVVSSMGADDGDGSSDDVFQIYLRAKGEADAAMRGRDLEWTIIRPGGLTDDPATGSITVGPTVDRGSITRADVAAVIATSIIDVSAIRAQFEVVNGATPIAEALNSL